RLPPETETALFRIVQEALANAHVHSGGREARIRIGRDSGLVSLEVSDFGRGIPAAVLERGDGVEQLGVGLPGMRERMRQIGGRLEIVQGQQGTIIRAVWSPKGES